jgi:hypothetical protein
LRTGGEFAIELCRHRPVAGEELGTGENERGFCGTGAPLTTKLAPGIYFLASRQ